MIKHSPKILAREEKATTIYVFMHECTGVVP